MIVLSGFGVALPAMIYVLHRRGIAVLFAVGAVSGTTYRRHTVPTVNC